LGKPRIFENTNTIAFDNCATKPAAFIAKQEHTTYKQQYQLYVQQQSE